MLDKIKDFINTNELISCLTKENAIKIAATAASGLVVFYIGNIWYSYGYFKKRGIKTPEYKFFFGNTLELQKYESFSDCIYDWGKEYGKLFGYYEGHLPVLVTSDLNLMEEIFVKQFINFSARRKVGAAPPDNWIGKSLLIATHMEWKRMRNIMNPTFSSSKLRDLNPLILICVDRLIEKLNISSATEVDVTETLKRFTMDTIWQCAFGIDADTQNKKDDPYFENCERVFRNMEKPNLLSNLSVLFHEFRGFFFFTLLFTSIVKGIVARSSVNPIFWLRREILNIYNLRKSNPKITKRDYVQILLETQTDDKSKLNKQFTSDDVTLTHFEKKMTTEEIGANLAIFLLAGYETTSSTLSNICYVLAMHPDEQDKLKAEIDENFIHDKEPNSDNVQKLNYMDMFVKEVLRMYPIGGLARRCIIPTVINGVEFLKNMHIMIDILGVHYNPEVWGPVDPHKFYPLRFSPEIKRHPMAFLGFGYGPRNCIGMKFALTEIKMALVKLLKQFRIRRSENTPTNLQFKQGIVRAPIQNIKVIFERAN